MSEEIVDEITKIKSLKDLRLLLSMEKYYKQKEDKHINNLLNSILVLKLSIRKYYLFHNNFERLFLYYRNNNINKFSKIYNTEFKNFNYIINKDRIFLDNLSNKNCKNVMQSIAFIRNNPTIISDTVCIPKYNLLKQIIVHLQWYKY